MACGAPSATDALEAAQFAKSRAKGNIIELE
jgi:hypothetical protein